MMEGLKKFTPALILFLVMPVFAMGNEFTEELIFRGFMQGALVRTIPNQSMVILL